MILFSEPEAEAEIEGDCAESYGGDSGLDFDRAGIDYEATFQKDIGGAEVLHFGPNSRQVFPQHNFPSVAGPGGDSEPGPEIFPHSGAGLQDGNLRIAAGPHSPAIPAAVGRADVGICHRLEIAVKAYIPTPVSVFVEQ